MERSLPLVVKLLPLNRNGVEKYTAARGVADATRFLEALEAAHAWDFARRPADVDDLFAFWREKGVLGTLMEILTFICDQQLRKTSDRETRELLSLDRARSGAEYLAAATFFCRKFTFRIPGESPSQEQSIDALACLPPDWRPEEVRSLLNHAIFDGASYGSIRFHHRRISEFLAARWIERLMQHGCPVVELEDLLSETRGPLRIIRPSMAPMAAWLCCGTEKWNRAVFRWVLEGGAEILLQYGDPACINVDDRRKLLGALSVRAEGREHLWWNHDLAALSRLAHRVLAPEVNAILRSETAGNSLRDLGLDLAIAGRLCGCKDSVMALAIEDLDRGQLFPSAARALELIGNDGDLNRLAEASSSVATLPERVCVPLCELLFPRIWGPLELMRALTRMQPSAFGGVGWDYSLSRHIESVATLRFGLPLIRQLLGQPAERRDGESEEIRRFQSPWTVRLAVAAASGVLKRPRVTDEEAAAVAEALVQLGRNSGIGLGSWGRDRNFDELTEQHPNVRECYFRAAAKWMGQKHNSAEPALSSISIFLGAIKPARADLMWLIGLIQNAPANEDRQRALRWSLEIWSENRRQKSDTQMIRRASRAFPELRRTLWRYFHPGLIPRLRGLWYRRVRGLFYGYRWRLAFGRVQDRWTALREKWNLFRHRRRLESGEYVGWIADLLNEGAIGNDQWISQDWTKLKEKRGIQCARAVRAGCKAVWRRFDPPLPHAKEPNTTPHHTVVGLAGIMAAWQDGELDFAALSFDDAQRATRYAVDELNGFAPWFFELVREQPVAVRSVLADCVAGEWQISGDSQNCHLVLSDLASQGESACLLARDAIMDRFTEGEPGNFQILQDALRVLLSPLPPPREQIASLAMVRAGSVPACAYSFAQWMAVWLQTDALPAIGSLRSRLASATDPTAVVVRVCSLLGGRSGARLVLVNDPSFLSPAALREFVPLVYGRVRIEDDVHRPAGQGYTPSARDDAQDFRNSLLQRLVATNEPMVERVLRDFLTEPPLAHLRDYIRHLLDQFAQQLAEAPPWIPTDVRTFADEYERDPKNDADLFHLVARRLSDLKELVENGEDSPRDEVNPSLHEAGFRRWLQRRLADSAKGRYIVPQEWEIDQAARLDLRVAIPGIMPLSVELKIAEKWTLSDLLDGLRTQLVGTYLRDSRSRYGIYVLAIFNRDRRWESLGGGPRLDCDGVFAVLKAEARSILASRPDLSGLEVMLVHFSPPPISRVA